MPTNLRKAEIDIRNGTLIREINALTEASPTPTPVTPKPKTSDPYSYYEEPPPPPIEVFVTSVPAEFRRIELFIAGTVPTRAMIQLDEEIESDSGTSPRASPTPSPLERSWQQDAESSEGGAAPARPVYEPHEPELTLMICPVTNRRATIACPDKVPKTFRKGLEPKDSCTFHR